MLIGNARQDQREPRGNSSAGSSFGRGCLSHHCLSDTPCRGCMAQAPLVSEGNPSPKEKGGPTEVL